MDNESLRAPAETAVRQCMDLGADESIAVVTDDERQPIGEALYEVAAEIAEESVILRYPPGGQPGEEPPGPVAAAMADADVFLAPTTKSVSHTQARSEATARGARGATLPGITEEVFRVGLDADYDGIRAACEAVLRQVAGATEIRVTSPQGTDVTVEPGEREWREDTGIVHEPGDFSNLPAGEVFVSPTTGDGRIVVDGTMMPHGKLDGREITIEVADGQVTHVDDAALNEELEDAAAEAGDAAFNLAELGIGTNVAVEELVGSVLLDEKAAGTVHFAIGDDHGIGGDVSAPIHLDCILTEPAVYADGAEVGLPE